MYETKGRASLELARPFSLARRRDHGTSMVMGWSSSKMNMRRG
jgi:hypothetical protein